MQNLVNPDTGEFVKQARYSDNYDYILDSDDKRVELNDQRIVHVIPYPKNIYGRRLTSGIYSKFNLKVRMTEETNAEILQYAKNICSGRECIPTAALSGAILYDIDHYRKEEEISIYRMPFIQNGPCQNGGWPMMLKTFSNRLNLKNIILGESPFMLNNFLGLPLKLIIEEIFADLACQFIEEARNALYCVAKEPESAIEQFEKITDDLVQEIQLNNVNLRDGLREWSKKISEIPHRYKVQDLPKILIIGGLNLSFTHYPVEKFFLDNQIIPKVIDTTDSLLFLFSEYLTREGFKSGKTTPKAQFSVPSLFLSYFFGKNKKEISELLYFRFIMYVIQIKANSIRDVMKSTGLLFEEDLDFINLFEESNKYVTCNTFSEASLITGRFIESVNSNYYDAIVNMGTFNCQPAMNSQAIIRPLANKTEMPYAAIDCEGPWMSTNQNRLLETITIQAKRYKENKNQREKTTTREDFSKVWTIPPFDTIKNKFIDLLEEGYIFYHEQSQTPLLSWLKLF